MLKITFYLHNAYKCIMKNLCCFCNGRMLFLLFELWSLVKHIYAYNHVFTPEGGKLKVHVLILSCKFHLPNSKQFYCRQPGYTYIDSGTWKWILTSKWKVHEECHLSKSLLSMVIVVLLVIDFM